MSKGKVALMIGAGLLVIYVAAAPYITVYQMKSAAEAHDGEALSEHIDFPSVRQSLKDQMNAMFTRKMAEDQRTQNNAFAAFGAALAGMMVEKVVDAYVTPAGITQLMAGQKPRQGSALSGGSTDSSDKKPLANASMSYESLDKFVVKVKSESGGEGKFVLRRRGLEWKLADIQVPFE